MMSEELRGHRGKATSTSSSGIPKKLEGERASQRRFGAGPPA